MMKNTAIKLAVLGAMGVIATQATADWTTLPAAGVSVGGNTSPYLLCNTTGDFGAGIVTKPTSNSDACARILPSANAVPDSTYTGLSALPITSATRTITMNNTYTNFSNVNVGELREYVWRKSTGGGNYECIYGMQITLQNVDYNLTQPDRQTFEVNDIARGGWGNVDLSVAYSTYPTLSEPTYRVGRTFTAVQRRDQTGYVNQPLTPGSTASINGVNVWPTPSGQPTATQQSAQLNTNWVDFTVDVNYADDDGSSVPISGTYYVRTACSNTLPTPTANAIRLRQTFQERSSDGSTPNPFIEVPMTGFLPTIGSGSVAPAPSSPF